MFPALWLQLGEKAISWAQVCCYLGAGAAGLLPSPLMGALLAPGDPPAGPAQAAAVQCPAAPPVPGDQLLRPAPPPIPCLPPWQLLLQTPLTHLAMHTSKAEDTTTSSFSLWPPPALGTGHGLLSISLLHG